MKRRTLSVLLVVIGILNIIRAGISFSTSTLFSKLNVALLLPLGGFYALSGIASIALAFVHWRMRRQFPVFFIILGYEIITWVLRIVTFRSTYARSLWLRDAIFSLLFLGIVYLLVRKPHKRAKNGI